jgi:hypothetical protein
VPTRRGGSAYSQGLQVTVATDQFVEPVEGAVEFGIGRRRPLRMKAF